jgi:hypothetical protein
MVLFYSFDAALLAGNLSSVIRGIATLQFVTVAATVLSAVPFGLIATCLGGAAVAVVVVYFHDLSPRHGQPEPQCIDAGCTRARILNLLGSEVQALQMNSYGVRPLSVLRRLAKL